MAAKPVAVTFGDWPLKPKDLHLKNFQKKGTGSFGKVYVGEWQGRPVAVKMLHDNLLGAGGDQTASLVASFKEECLKLRRLDHGRVVKLIATYRDECGRPLLVMEAQEENLEAYLRRNAGKLTVVRQITIVNELADGLAYLHEKNIVHRDLKPANVMVGKDGGIRIADLGQAKLLPNGIEQLMQTTQPGTPLFLPPEALRHGESHLYTVSIDCFSLGVIALCVATQAFPTCDWTEIGVVEEAVRRKKDLDKLPQEHPLESIILGCLQNTPSLRPRSFFIKEHTQALLEKLNLESQLETKSLTVMELRQDLDRRKQCTERLQEEKQAVVRDFQAAKEIWIQEKAVMEYELQVSRQQTTSLQKEKSSLVSQLGSKNRIVVELRDSLDSQKQQSAAHLRKEKNVFESRISALKEDNTKFVDQVRLLQERRVVDKAEFEARFSTLQTDAKVKIDSCRDNLAGILGLLANFDTNLQPFFDCGPSVASKQSSLPTPDSARHLPQQPSADDSSVQLERSSPRMDGLDPDVIRLMKKNTRCLEDLHLSLSPDNATVSAVGESKCETMAKFVDLYNKFSTSLVKEAFHVPTRIDRNIFLKKLEAVFPQVIFIPHEDDNTGVSLLSLDRPTLPSIVDYCNLHHLLDPPVSSDNDPFIVIQLPHRGTLTIKKGNLVKEEVSAIVSAANEQLQHIGGVAFAIDRASHGQVQPASKQAFKQFKLPKVPTGQALMTSAGGNLKCDAVIHAVGPDAAVFTPEQCTALLRQACEHSLRLAEEHKMTSVAFPPISSGILGVDATVVAQVLIDAICQYKYGPNSTLVDVRIVVIDGKTLQPFLDYGAQVVYMQSSLPTPDPTQSPQQPSAHGKSPQPGQERNSASRQSNPTSNVYMSNEVLVPLAKKHRKVVLKKGNVLYTNADIKIVAISSPEGFKVGSNASLDRSLDGLLQLTVNRRYQNVMPDKYDVFTIHCPPNSKVNCRFLVVANILDRSLGRHSDAPKFLHQILHSVCREADTLEMPTIAVTPSTFDCGGFSKDSILPAFIKMLNKYNFTNDEFLTEVSVFAVSDDDFSVLVQSAERTVGLQPRNHPPRPPSKPVEDNSATGVLSKKGSKARAADFAKALKDVVTLHQAANPAIVVTVVVSKSEANELEDLQETVRNHVVHSSDTIVVGLKAPGVQNIAAVSSCLVLKHMFNPNEQIGVDWTQKIRDDVIDETSKFGYVYHIHVDATAPDGSVYVKCQSPQVATAAVNALNGNTYAGIIISAQLMPESNYYGINPMAMTASMPLLSSTK